MRTILSAAAVTTALLGSARARQAYGSIGVTTEDGFDDVAPTGRIGGTFNEHLGTEVEASCFVDAEFGFAAGYAVGRLPAGERIDVIARVGYGLFTDFGASEDALAYGIGPQHAVGPRPGVRADYMRVDAGTGFDEGGILTLSYVFESDARRGTITSRRRLAQRRRAGRPSFRTTLSTPSLSTPG